MTNEEKDKIRIRLAGMLGRDTLKYPTREQENDWIWGTVSSLLDRHLTSEDMEEIRKETIKQCGLDE